jgi:hypothetical protein
MGLSKCIEDAAFVETWVSVKGQAMGESVSIMGLYYRSRLI